MSSDYSDMQNAAATELLRQSGAFVEGVLGVGIKDWAQARFGWWQMNVLSKILRKAERKIADGSLDKRVVKLSYLGKYFEAAADVDESDEDLLELWASLLVGCVTDSKHQHPAFVHTLRQLSSGEVRLLNHVLEAAGEYAGPPSRLCVLVYSDYIDVVSGGFMMKDYVFKFHYQSTIASHALKGYLTHPSDFERFRSMGLFERYPVASESLEFRSKTGARTVDCVTEFGQSLLYALGVRRPGGA